MPGNAVRPVAVRFWEKVDHSGGPDACWPWTAARHRNGYGKFGLTRRRTLLIHRMAWELTNGPIPPGMFVCHTCDHPPCCNPAHLFLGDHRTNMADMTRKGHTAPGGAPTPERQARGERIAHAKLTAPDVRAIRLCYAQGGITFAALGRLYGVSDETVRVIVRRRAWAHVA